MDTTTHPFVGTRVYEAGWPNTLGTVEQESPAKDGWFFVRFEHAPGRPSDALLSIPRSHLQEATEEDEARVREYHAEIHRRVLGK